MEKDEFFCQRWICQVHVLPSSLDEYYCPDAIGAYVSIVGDAETEEQLKMIVKSTLEEKMFFPVLEISDIEVLTPNHQISQELQESIDQLLPIFPIAFSAFYYYGHE